MTILLLAGLIGLTAVGVTTKDNDTRMLSAFLVFALAMLGAK